MSELVIRPLDPHDDADMDGFQDVYAASELAEDPDAALYSREDGIAMLTSGDQSSLFDAFGAFVNDRMVAETILMGSLRDNLELGQVLLGSTRTTAGRVSAHERSTASRSTLVPAGAGSFGSRRASARGSRATATSPSGTGTRSR